jgi:hypothetical protein
MLSTRFPSPALKKSCKFTKKFVYIVDNKDNTYLTVRKCITPWEWVPE